MEAYGITDRGKVRRQNQDAFWISCDKSPAILAVCDGMGGAKAGNVASDLAIKVFRCEAVRRLAEEPGADIGDILRDAVVSANTAVFELSKSSSAMSGMGTTFVAAVAKDCELTVINVGDSRAYRISGGEIRQITRDHSLVEDMVERGDITREQSRNHPNKNLITRAVGTMATVESDVFVENADAGDTVLLASDGLTNVVFDDEIRDAIAAEDDVRRSCERLMELALSRGAPDNVTVAALRI